MKTVLALSLTVCLISVLIGFLFQHAALRVSKNSFLHRSDVKWWQRDEAWYDRNVWRSLFLEVGDLSDEGLAYRRIGWILWKLAAVSGGVALIALVADSILTE